MKASAIPLKSATTFSKPYYRGCGTDSIAIARERSGCPAGGSGGDLKIDGLNADTAERLRVFILDKVGASVENA